MLLFLPSSNFAFIYLSSTGEANVTIKDSVFQQSSPIRHGTELMAINTRLKKKPEAFTLAFTDGGPIQTILFFM